MSPPASACEIGPHRDTVTHPFGPAVFDEVSDFFWRYVESTGRHYILTLSILRVVLKCGTPVL